MRITLPDDTAERLALDAETATVDIGTYLQRRLALLDGIKPRETPLVLSADQRRAIERLFNTTLPDADALVTLLSKSGIHLQQVRVNLGAKQLEALHAYAQKNNRSLREIVREHVQAVTESLWGVVAPR